MNEELSILQEYISSSGLRRTLQREQILEIFLSTENHVSLDELHSLVLARYPRIGHTTVYRTMKILLELKLAKEVLMRDGTIRYEHKYGHLHHDHLQCTACGKIIEFCDPRLEDLQEHVAGKHGFVPTDHVLQIYGVCKDCTGCGTHHMQGRGKEAGR